MIINDPTHGFISITSPLIKRILSFPAFQRLTRIHQLGLTYLVYPGAQHTRFSHSIGAMHLMDCALQSLIEKGYEVSRHEHESALAAILLHDVGHAPFSHVLEQTLSPGIHHEEISLLITEQLNREMPGRLQMAIDMFTGKYPRPVFHELISGALDVDRMDYLSRDAYFTGVVEGVIGQDRILKMLTTDGDHLAIEQKAVYSIEKFLIARRMMYWQVYFHKTSIAAERLLISLLRRAKYLAQHGEQLFCSPSLHYFLYGNITGDDFRESNSTALRYFLLFDDSDILSAVKVWRLHSDNLLRALSEALIDRHLFKVTVTDEEPTEEDIERVRTEIMRLTNFTREETEYLISLVPVSWATYSPEKEAIKVKMKDGSTEDISDLSAALASPLLRHKETKYFLCHYNRDELLIL